MKYLIFIPFVFLAACSESTNQSASGSGQIINAGESISSSVTQPQSGTATTLGTNAQGQCSEKSREAGIC